MAYSVSQRRNRNPTFRLGAKRYPVQDEESNLDQDDIAMPPEVSASERTRNRVWRAISWVLLANVVMFWVMTCIAAFAHGTAA